MDDSRRAGVGELFLRTVGFETPNVDHVARGRTDYGACDWFWHLHSAVHIPETVHSEG